MLVSTGRNENKGLVENPLPAEFWIQYSDTMKTRAPQAGHIRPWLINIPLSGEGWCSEEGAKTKSDVTVSSLVSEFWQRS